ncbi:MAG: FtsX-like permease family protein [Desulfatiglans sp.]|nr:FtsX-like permease family protein [Desulfatiglans sp.]
MKDTKFLRDVQLGIENLLLHKLRSFLTALGVIFGVCSVVAMLSVGEGASKEAMDQIRKVGSNNITITSVKSREDEATTSTRTRMSVYGITYKDFERIEGTFSSIRTAVPVKEVRKQGRLGDRTLELRVVGTTPAWFDLVRRPLEAGRVLTQSDLVKESAVAVLTEYGARRLLATRGSIGQNLSIGENNFQIVGIVKSEAESGSGTDIQLPDLNVDAYIPLNVARSYYGDISMKRSTGSEEMNRIELNKAIVQVDDLENVESTAKAIEAMLQKFHPKKDYEMSVPLAMLRQAEAQKRTTNIVLGSIAGISLLVGGIGIMNIMLASVTERTREIGIRRAIGAKKKQIITQFLIETVVLSTIGGIVGLCLGIIIPLLITLFTKMPTVITAFSIILPFVISIGIGIIFGIYPAARAAEVDPIIALRHE